MPAMRPDVVIAGAGPAGCATAIALAQRGISSRVVDRGGATRARSGEMLQPAARRLLEQLDVDVSAQPRALGVSSAWESEALEQNDFFAGMSGDGWLLDRATFDAALATAARDAGVTFVGDCDLRGCFVVDATGSAAAIARARGAKRIAYDRLTGIFGTFPDAEGAGFTLIEAVEDGWWYRGGGVVAFMSDVDIIRSRRMHEVRNWLDALELTAHAGRRLGRRTPRLRIRSGGSAILDRVVGENWVAVGDAASTWDPLSAAGIHKALRNGVDAANAIANGTLDQYERGLRASFHDYLATRDRYYSLVRRWPRSLFWERRREAITLDPSTPLRAHNTSRAAMANIDPRLRLPDVVAMCDEPRLARDVVAACAARHGDASVILALQAMLREGVLYDCRTA
jgi:flavin-dependent dehydrogenase